jgi:Zn-finger domain-containing protein
MEIKDVNSNYVQQSQLQYGKAVVAKEQKPADANDFKKSNEEIENKQVDMDKITDVLKNKLDKIQKLFTGEARFEV